MKKILFYLCGIYNGGTEIETLNLMKNLNREKFLISSISYTLGNESVMTISCSNIVNFSQLELGL